ncbi:MAG: NAD(P)H-dependent oxidoreductase [Thermomicrobiales bacterium]|nr:NAD(P)H-dependent oxidoreductase [Thermomicrobiales bacterium]
MNSAPLNLAIIIGSVREGRFGPTVARWFAGQAAAHGGYNVNVIDLADYDIPSNMTRNSDVERFSEQIAVADAIVVVTQEYNHSFAGPLKTAIDALKKEWHGKPVGFVAYGGISGGLRAVEALRIVFAEVHATTIRESVAFPLAWQKFDANGQPVEAEIVGTAAKLMLDNLEWWGVALREMRDRAPYGQPLSAVVAD